MKKLILILTFFGLFSLAPSAIALGSGDEGNKLYTDENMSISNVYPNPASTFVSFNYHFNGESTAKITIHNVIGGSMGEFELNSFDSKLKIDLHDYKPGVYFYTLSVGGKKVVTKKFLVRN